MMLFWKIRYLDRNTREFKDRYLYLRTETLDPATRAAVELVTEAKAPEDRRVILKFKHLFEERTLDSLPTNMDGVDEFRSVGPAGYFEDETGAEIKPGDLWKYLRPEGQPEPEVVEAPQPVPLAQVSLTPDEIRLLGYFTRDCRELSDSALMREGPGTITTPGGLPYQGARRPTFKTALSDDEVRSFVTTFRRLYMEKEPAGLKKAVALFVQAVGDHPYARLVASFADGYQKGLDSPTRVPSLMAATARQFTTKRLIDVFLYTQYAHQSDKTRQRQFNECLAEVQGDRNILTWLFLYGIWASGIHIDNAGRAIDAWFQRYCAHHGITPYVLNSIRHEGVGFGTLEKEEDRKARPFRERIEELEMELWKRAGRPEGGPVQFRAAAREQLNRALQGGES